MKLSLHSIVSVAALVGLCVAPTTFAATGEVTLSGSTWTGKVDGTTKYTGSSLAAAANACVAAMSSGTVNIRNSGSTAQINIKSNVRVNGNGVTLTGSGTGGIVRATNSSSTGCDNINMAGDAWFGMYFSTCQGTSFSSTHGTSGIAYRIDNCKGGGGSNFTFGQVKLTAGGDNGVETYGINGVSWNTVTATDRGACGMLLNYSSNAAGTAVNGTRCCYGGGYAGFRTANTNTSTTLGTVNSTSCGRGYFSVSGSNSCTVSTVNATNCSSHGVWLQTAANTKVNAGTVTNCHPCSSISTDNGGNSIKVTCK
jgi:hypothetical protein